MNNRKTIGIALLVIGVVLVIVSLTADAIGIGGTAIFGYKQIIGAIAGVVIAVVGFVLYSRKQAV
jgi:cytochrome c biogenesis protein CcdA